MTDSHLPIGQDPSDPLLQGPRIARARPPPSSPPLLMAEESLPLCTCCSLSRMPFPIHLPTEFSLPLPPLPLTPFPKPPRLSHKPPWTHRRLPVPLAPAVSSPRELSLCAPRPSGPLLLCPDSSVLHTTRCLHSGWELLKVSDFPKRPLSPAFTADQRWLWAGPVHHPLFFFSLFYQFKNVPREEHWGKWNSRQTEQLYF